MHFQGRALQCENPALASQKLVVNPHVNALPIDLAAVKFGNKSTFLGSTSKSAEACPAGAKCAVCVWLRAVLEKSWHWSCLEQTFELPVVC